MQKVFASNDLNPRDRFDYWMDAVGRNCLEVDSRLNQEQEFTARIQGAVRAASVLSIFELSNCDVMRGKPQVTRSANDNVLITLQLGGAVEAIDGDHEETLRPGEIWIIDSAQPCTHKNVRCESIVLSLPRGLLECRLGHLAFLSHRKIQADAPSTRLAATLLKSLPACFVSADAATMAQVQDTLFDLLTVGYLGEEHSCAATRNYARLAARFRLKSTVETHLFDSRLRPADFAQKAGIGARHANSILAADGTSLERYVFARRLERSRAVLDNRALDFRSLSEIAYSNGFASLAHFSRRFKQAYGLTPSEYRHRRGD
ncbi:MAG: helix-turn-helix domain-containing protein [Methyloceanibacter sp.]|nr:helix-turn-helix domain-containing protein [Methyloceanibacter sp.]